MLQGGYMSAASIQAGLISCCLRPEAAGQGVDSSLFQPACLALPVLRLPEAISK